MYCINVLIKWSQKSYIVLLSPGFFILKKKKRIIMIINVPACKRVCEIIYAKHVESKGAVSTLKVFAFSSLNLKTTLN